MSTQIASASTGKSAGKNAAKRGRKRARRNVLTGRVYINASFNNTMITITDEYGNKLTQNSAGQAGYKGSRKSTPFAAQVAAETAGNMASTEFGMKVVTIFVDGPGPGRESAIRAFLNLGFKVIAFIDNTGIPHNGVRRPKKRRV
ncbi:MAG: 30S ribosomal protein S11 [Legionellaceae bacterium]